MAENISSIAKKRGLSVNSLIAEIAWDFVEQWKKITGNRGKKYKHKMRTFLNAA